MRIESNLDHACEHLRHLRDELHDLRQPDRPMSYLQVRPVFGSRPSLLHGSYTGLLLEHTHEPLREV
jgi:hypothetical protein